MPNTLLLSVGLLNQGPICGHIHLTPRTRLFKLHVYSDSHIVEFPDDYIIIMHSFRDRMVFLKEGSLDIYLYHMEVYP